MPVVKFKRSPMTLLALGAVSLLFIMALLWPSGTPSMQPYAGSSPTDTMHATKHGIELQYSTDARNNATFTVLILESDRKLIANLHYWRTEVLAQINVPTEYLVVPSMEEIPLYLRKNTGIFATCPSVEALEVVVRKFRHENPSITNIGLFRLVDETGSDQMHTYAVFDFVIKEYYYDHQDHPEKVVWVPLGYTDMRGPTPNRRQLMPSSKRRLICYFRGWGRSSGTPADRSQMLKYFEDEQIVLPGGDRRPKQLADVLPNAQHVWPSLHQQQACTVELPNSFEEVLSGLAYMSKMSDTMFALAPAGNVPESFRFNEALEFGAIPLLPAENFVNRFFKESGIPIYQQWSETLPTLAQLMADPERLDALQLQVIEWWYNFKKARFQLVAEQVLSRWS